jgi:hypothetical protein
VRGRAGGRAREPGWIPRANEARGVRLRWCVFKVRVYAFACRVRMLCGFLCVRTFFICSAVLCGCWRGCVYVSGVSLLARVLVWSLSAHTCVPPWGCGWI